MDTEPLFQPLDAGALRLRNRIVMAPMTRSRADDDGVVGPLTARYYAQRASAGLVLTEGLYPEAMGKGYVRTPGLASEAHVAAWRRVAEAVHRAGAPLVAQVMHTGRISDPVFLGGATPVAPSAVRPDGTSYTDEGPRPHVTPRALGTHEIRSIVDAYAAATRRALAAGFDGVELHAGSGYLPMQFLSSSTNRRDDGYGGSVRRRLRFVLECLDAMAAVAGPGRVGIKLMPESPFNGAFDEHPVETYAALAGELARRDLAFVEGVSSGERDWHALLRPLLRGTAYFMGGGLTPAAAAAHVAAGRADAAVFGQLFIANPDLPHRIRTGAPLAEADRDTFYTPGPRGYVDYPALAGARELA